MKKPFEKSWWVKEGCLLAGCYPGDRDNDVASSKLRRLLDAGVRYFVSLQEPGERANGVNFKPYIPLLNEIAQELNLDVEYANFPIPDMGVPDKGVLDSAITAIDQALHDGKGVYVHCWGGHGRTGTVVGCWLTSQGVSGDEAFKQISQLRSHEPYLAGRPSPQTPMQRNIVLNWALQQETSRVARAQGCLLGQLSGDALGSLVEFRSPEDIRREYPDGVRKLADGGTFNTIAGQPTDDSEMALLLARMLVEHRAYDPGIARKAYVYWLESGPFDYGMTISSGLSGRPNPDSQANGAMMRVSPLGIFGANYDLKQVAQWARRDAALTHSHPVCQQANALFVMAIAEAIRSGLKPDDLYRRVIAWARDMSIDEVLMKVIIDAEETPPADYTHQRGWVLIAFRNALWQLLHAPNLEEAVIDTVMRGGDTDTNAAICGALLGAVHGREAVPAQWIDCLLNCRPMVGQTHVHHPRPECFWPVDALELAANLLTPKMK